MEDPGFIFQHHTSLEEDGALPGHFRVFRGTKSGISSVRRVKSSGKYPMWAELRA